MKGGIKHVNKSTSLPNTQKQPEKSGNKEEKRVWQLSNDRSKNGSGAMDAKT